MTRKHFLDLIDYQIIKELRTNARISAVDIAYKIDANERTIRKRIDRLVESGIVRLTTILNPQAFGYVVAVDIFIEASMDREQEIINSLLDMPSITYLAYGQESTELSIEARFKDNDEARDFLRKTLPSISGVTVKGSTLVPKILRNIDEWIPPEEEFNS